MAIPLPSDVSALIEARSKSVFMANLYTFELVNGKTYRFTDARKSITVGTTAYQASALKITPGRVKLSRGVSVDSHQLKISEADGAFIEMILLGYFNLAIYTMQRILAADASSPWTTPVTRFAGQVSSIDEIGRSYAKITVKSMMNILDNDFPRNTVQTDCKNVLFDTGCSLSRAAYLTPGTVSGVSTVNTLRTALAQATGYFAQGIITFTSGKLAGISYYVKENVGSTIYPAYPFLVPPSIGDSFKISPGCDKTLATCTSKFSNQANFYGEPFVPDPTVLY